jgi:hypothetical protein
MTGIGFDVGMVDRGANHPRRLEGMGVGLSPVPSSQRISRPPCERCRRFDGFL